MERTKTHTRTQTHTLVYRRRDQTWYDVCEGKICNMTFIQFAQTHIYELDTQNSSFPLANSYHDERCRRRGRSKKNYPHEKTNPTLTKIYTCSIRKHQATQFLLKWSNLLCWMLKNDIWNWLHIQLDEELKIVLSNIVTQHCIRIHCTRDYTWFAILQRKISILIPGIIFLAILCAQIIFRYTAKKSTTLRYFIWYEMCAPTTWH